MPNARARQFRKNLTPAERKLWRSLRQLKQHGLHFRRQVPFGYYIADFACHRAKLIIEIDGVSHINTEEYDSERTTFLNSRGYRVLRFWNSDVFENRTGVVDRIVEIAKSSHP